jgi:DNA-binding ferritin-like protein
MPQPGQNEDTAAVLAIDRENRAVLLYCSGMTYAEVAEAIGYANAGSAHKAVQRALKKRAEETFAARDEMIAQQLEVCRLIIRGLMPKIIKGESRSGEVAIKAQEHVAKLLGLYAPVKVDAKISDAFMAELDELAEQIVALDAQQAAALSAQSRG